MSSIPQTRTIGQFRRVNIPADIAGEYPKGATFVTTVEDGDIVLTISESGDGNQITDKNRVRLPPGVVDQFADDVEFAVFQDGHQITLRPTDNIEISL